jgi:copper resistance protein D
MLEAGLIFSRFLHYATLMALFGVSLFPLYAYPRGTDPQPARLIGWVQMVLLAASVAALLTGILWLAFTTANMTGTLSAAADRDALWSVLRDTGFGHVWMARLALCILLIGLAGLPLLVATRPHESVLTVILAGGLLASLAGTGHTQQHEGMASVVHVAADGAHLLAAGAWLGGLLALGFILTRAIPDADTVLTRFSGMGYIAVAVLVGSGLINSCFLVGSVANLIGTPYGQLLLVKLCLFAGMLALAVSNRFWLVPSLARDGQAAAAIVRLRRHVLGEETLGLVVLLIVSGLGTMEPAVSQMSP